MASRSIGVDDRTYAYVLDASPPEHPALRALRSETDALGGIARMQIGRDQAQLMALIVRLIGARKVLEIGTFTGYSSTAMALAMPEGGRLVTCDVSEEYTAIARRTWRAAGVEERIDLRIAPALETLDVLARGGETFDLAFVDADKSSYDAYWDRCAGGLIRPGGLILVDNVLWSGRVADPAASDADTEAIRRVNRKIRDDGRVSMAMIAAFDGLTIAMVR
jgi:O-methyltransferase